MLHLQNGSTYMENRDGNQSTHPPHIQWRRGHVHPEYLTNKLVFKQIEGLVVRTEGYRASYFASKQRPIIRIWTRGLTGKQECMRTETLDREHLV